MSTIQFGGYEWRLPYRGRFGTQIAATLSAIMQSREGIALYKAMGLRGRAKLYEGRYRAAFSRFAQVNQDKLAQGLVGPKGGFGYRFIGGTNSES